MKNRIIHLSKHYHLSTKNEQLLIRNSGLDTMQIPIEDVSVLNIEGNGTTIQQELLVKLASNNVAVIICDKRHLPISILLPLYSHTNHTKILHQQINSTQRIKKALWKTIIKAKIHNQYEVTRVIGKESMRLKRMLTEVKVGDPSNIEAQASRLYFKIVFGNNFIRDREKYDDINIAMNYCYSVIRAMVARSLIATGLNLSLGLFHKNQYNPFVLVDDVMEPLRPFVDLLIYESFDINKKFILTKDNKEKLLKIITYPCIIKDQAITIDIAIKKYCESFKNILIEENIKDKFFEIPKICN